jgi:hypothetical protein
MCNKHVVNDIAMLCIQELLTERSRQNRALQPLEVPSRPWPALTSANVEAILAGRIVLLRSRATLPYDSDATSEGDNIAVDGVPS